MDITEYKLERLILESQEFEKLPSALDVFCPFEAIGMVRQEIKHSHFLSYVLDPTRPHGFGTECLRGFMWTAAAALSEDVTSMIRPLDVHLMDLDSTIINREYKNIDLLIQIPVEKMLIAIELKIDSGEHSGQLGRYRKVIANDFPESDGWQHAFLFLTKRGDEPSENDGEKWQSLSLGAVASSFESVIGRGNGTSEARMMLGAYVSMLRRKHLTDARLDGLARNLWREHREALEFLMARRPDITADVFNRIFESLPDTASRFSKETGFGIVPEHSTRSYARFGIEAWDAVPGMDSGTGWKPSNRMLLFEISRDSKTGIRCHFVLGPGSSPERETIFTALRDAGAEIGGNWPLAAKWRQMGTVAILPVPTDDGDNIESIFDEVIVEAEKFLKKHMPIYNEVLVGLIPK